MRPKGFAVLAIATAVVVSAAIFVQRGSGRSAESSKADQRLYPDLAKRIDDAASLTVEGHGQTVTVKKKGDEWVVPDKGGYPAGMDTVRQAVRGMADMTVVEPKTSKPDLYDRIGVQDPDAKGSTSTLVTINGSDDKPLASLIIGQRRPGANPTLFVRKKGEQRAWLVKGALTAPTAPLSWVDRTILDVPRDQVQSVTITQPDGEQLTVQRGGKDDQRFDVEGVPEGRALKTATVADPIGGALTRLELVDVKPASDVKFDGPNATHAEYHLTDGVVLAADLVDEGGKTWARFSATPPAPKPAADAQPQSDSQAKAPAAASPAATDDATATKTGDSAKAGADAKATAAATPDTPKGEDPAEQAEKINATVKGWAYQLPSYKAQYMRRKMEDLLKPVEKPKAAQQPAPAQPGPASATPAEPAAGPQGPLPPPPDNGDGRKQ